MNITNHAFDRFTERIVGIADQLAARQYINQNKEKITEDINKLVEFSELLFTGQINGDKSTKNYLLRDNIILVTDTANSALITLYKIDFGFGDKTDRLIASNLKEDIMILKKQLCDKKLDIDTNVEYKKYELNTIESQVETLKQQLFMLELKKNTKESEIKVAYNDVEILSKDIEMLAVKLCNSLEYKKDILRLAK